MPQDHTKEICKLLFIMNLVDLLRGSLAQAALTLCNITTRPDPRDCIAAIGADLSPTQKLAMNMSLERQLNNIQCPHVTGKTWTAAHIVKAWTDAYRNCSGAVE